MEECPEAQAVTEAARQDPEAASGYRQPTGCGNGGKRHAPDVGGPYKRRNTQSQPLPTQAVPSEDAGDSAPTDCSSANAPSCDRLQLQRDEGAQSRPTTVSAPAGAAAMPGTGAGPVVSASACSPGSGSADKAAAASATSHPPGYDPVTSATKSVVEASQAICAASAASIAAALAKLQAATHSSSSPCYGLPPAVAVACSGMMAPGAYSWAAYGGAAPVGWQQRQHMQAVAGRAPAPLSLQQCADSSHAAAVDGCLLSPQPSASSCFASPPASPIYQRTPVTPTAGQPGATMAAGVQLGRLVSPPPVVTLVTGSSPGGPYKTVTLHSLPLAAALAQSHVSQLGHPLSSWVPPAAVTGGLGSVLPGNAVWGVPVADAVLAAAQGQAAAALSITSPHAGLPVASSCCLGVPAPAGAAVLQAAPGACITGQQVHVGVPAAAVGAQKHLQQELPGSPGSVCSDCAAVAAQAASHAIGRHQEASSSKGEAAPSAALLDLQQHLQEELATLREQQQLRLAAASAAQQAAQEQDSSKQPSKVDEQLLSLQRAMVQEVEQLQQKLAAHFAALQQHVE